MRKYKVTQEQLERIVRALHAQGDECHRQATRMHATGNRGAFEAYRDEQRACTQLARDLRENLR